MGDSDPREQEVLDLEQEMGPEGQNIDGQSLGDLPPPDLGGQQGDLAAYLGGQQGDLAAGPPDEAAGPPAGAVGENSHPTRQG